MTLLVTSIFILGYLLIALEYRINIDKAATAIFIGVLSWLTLFIGHLALGQSLAPLEAGLMHHLAEAASILFFLLGAMTIVEVIDSYDGFRFVLRLLRVRSLWGFLVLATTLTFFLSATIDNLTTTLVMGSILQRVIPAENRNVRLLALSLIVLASNAGGAWSPLGDVTTTMLWIKGCITEKNIILKIFLPSLVSVAIPLLILGRLLRGAQLEIPTQADSELPKRSSLVIFLVGLGGILAVPAMKIFLGLPPFMGMLLSMAIVWMITELFYQRFKSTIDDPARLRIDSALQVIDTPSLLFFLGILLAVGALSEVGILRGMANFLINKIGNMDVVIYILGLISAIVDNVPLVAIVIEMFPLSTFPTDHRIWEFLAYCVGVGGNLLIIGSAAGVVAMGIEKIEFFWYLKRISWIAFLSYTAGALFYVLLV